MWFRLQQLHVKNSVFDQIVRGHKHFVLMHCLFLCTFVYFMHCRRRRFSSCTMKTRRSRVTTSWTNGFSPSRNPSSSSSRLRWTVREKHLKLTHCSFSFFCLLDMDSGCKWNHLMFCNPSHLAICSCCFRIQRKTLTAFSYRSLPPVHRRASPGQVCGHAHQLVRQDQQTPPEGEIPPLNLCLLIDLMFLCKKDGRYRFLTATDSQWSRRVVSLEWWSLAEECADKLNA